MKLSADLLGDGDDAPAAGIAHGIFQNLDAELEIIEEGAGNTFFDAQGNRRMDSNMNPRCHLRLAADLGLEPALGMGMYRKASQGIDLGEDVLDFPLE
jgi:hypothetical protein